MKYEPEIVQVVPFPDYTVDVYFSDGKIVSYSVKDKLDKEVFSALSDIHIFINRCKIMNDTLAWDINDSGDETECIDIDPNTLYALDDTSEKIA